MKKVFAIVLCMMVMLSLAGCGADGAQVAFEEMMQAFQTAERERISEYYDFQELGTLLNVQDQEEMLAVVLETLKKMEYQIESVEKIDSANVKITTKITTLDFSKVMEQYIQNVLLMVADPDYQARVANMSQEEYQGLIAAQMAEVLESRDIPMQEKTISVTMVKENDRWVLGGDKNALLEALFSNLIHAVNVLL